MTLGLGLDAGGSATRWVLAGPAGVVARGEVPPLPGLLFSDAARQRAAAAAADLAAALHALPGPHVPDAVVAGITGLTRGAPAAEEAAALLAAALRVPAERIEIGDDLTLAYRARFAPGEGILVYAGTGSAALHLTGPGEAVRAGGFGFLLDDGGSAFAIARDALRAVLRAEDAAPGSGWSTPLGAELAAGIGGTSWDAVRGFVYGGDRGEVAALARRVAGAAGADPRARDVLDAAGRELARLAAVLLRRLGPHPVALAGRAARLHPVIAVAMQEALGRAVEPGEGDAALAAARLALDRAAAS